MPRKYPSGRLKTPSIVDGIIFLEIHPEMRPFSSPKHKEDLVNLKNDADELAHRRNFNLYLNNEQRDLRSRAGDSDAMLTPAVLRGRRALASLTDSSMF